MIHADARGIGMAELADAYLQQLRQQGSPGAPAAPRRLRTAVGHALVALGERLAPPTCGPSSYRPAPR
jgi:hypothetical protein